MRLRRLLALCLLLPLLAACGKDPQATPSSTPGEGLSTPSTTFAPVLPPNDPQNTPSEAVLPPENTASTPLEAVLTPENTASTPSEAVLTPVPSTAATATPKPAATPASTPTPAPSPTATPTVEAEKEVQPVVPDVQAFLGLRKNSNSKHKYNATYEEYEEVALDQYETLKSELTGLLSRYALKELSAVKKDITDATWQYRVNYAYTGEGVESYTRSGYEGVHVSLLFTGYTQTGELAISYTYVDGLTAADPGTRTAATLPSGSSGSTGSSSVEKDCWYCGGSGTCPTCHGSGTVRKWVAGTVNDYVDQTCTDCYSPGKCRMCGGSGHE